jgi:dihydrofolate reductase
MTKLKLNITMSLDGYVAGLNQSVDHPLGKDGNELHKWLLDLRTFHAMHGTEGGVTGPDDDIAAEMFENIGATIMGRHMFGGGDGPWGDQPWTGWWGENPPYHMPVFVLTHHLRKSLEMQGEQHFISSPKALTPRSSEPEILRGTNTSCSPAAQISPSNFSRPD